MRDLTTHLLRKKTAHLNTDWAVQIAEGLYSLLYSALLLVLFTSVSPFELSAQCPTAVTISTDQPGDICLGTTGIQYNANVTGGDGTQTYLWCAYNNSAGTGTCFNGFSDNTSQNPTRNWTSSTGPKSVEVTVSQTACANVVALLPFNVVNSLTPPSTTVFSADHCYGEPSAPARRLQIGPNTVPALGEEVVWRFLSFTPGTGSDATAYVNGNLFTDGENNAEFRITNNGRSFRPQQFATGGGGNPIYGTYTLEAFVRKINDPTCTSPNYGPLTKTINPRPALQAELNSVPVIDNNDGVMDVGSFAVCDGVANNISITTAFSELNGIGGTVRVWQTVTPDANTNFGPWCNNCQAMVGAFTAGISSTASLINPTLPGSVVITFQAWADANNNGVMEGTECAGDVVEYTVTVNPAPAITINQFAGNPFNMVCSGDEARFLASASAAGPPSVGSYTWTFSSNSSSPTVTQYGQTASDGTTKRNQGSVWTNTTNASIFETVDLTVAYDNGCVVTAPQHSIEVKAVPAISILSHAGYPFNMACSNERARFLASPPAAGNATYPPVQTYAWTFSGTPNNLQNIGQVAADGTTYRNQETDWTNNSAADVNQTVDLEVEYTNGCKVDAPQHTITIKATPDVTILPFAGNPFSAVCSGTEARFLASPPAAGPPSVQTYAWTYSGTPTVNDYGQKAADNTTYRNQGATWVNTTAGDITETVDLTVTYTNSCSATAPQHTVTVHPLPVMTCPNNIMVCENDPDVNLLSLTPTPAPAGGTFSGPGVNGNMFEPATAGSATSPHTITYSYTDVNGCTNTCTFIITVNPNPAAPPIGTQTKMFCHGDPTVSPNLAGTGVSVNPTLSAVEKVVWKLTAKPANSAYTVGDLFTTDNCGDPFKNFGELAVANTSKVIRVNSNAPMNAGNPIFGTYEFDAYVENCNTGCLGTAVGTFSITIKERPVLDLPNFPPTVCSDQPLSSGNWSGFMLQTPVTGPLNITSMDYNSKTVHPQLTDPGTFGANAAIPAMAQTVNYIDNDNYTNQSSGGRTVTYNVTATANNGCSSDPTNVDFNILAEPVMQSYSGTICSDVATGYNFQLTPTSWGNVLTPPNLVKFMIVSIVPAPGLVAGGANATTGGCQPYTAIASDTWNNPTGGNLNVVYTVRPQRGCPPPGVCNGDDVTITFTIKPDLFMDFSFIHPSNYFGEICNGDEVNVDVLLNPAVASYTEGTDYQFKMVTVRHSTSSTGPWTNGYGPVTGTQNYANGQVLNPSEVKETLTHNEPGYIYIQYNLVLEDLLCNQTHYRGFVICIKPKLKMDFFFTHPSNYFGEICNGDEVDVDVDLIAAQQGILPFTEGTDYQFKMVAVDYSTSQSGPWTSGYGPVTGSQNYANGQVLSPSEVKETLTHNETGYIYIRYSLVLEDLMCNQTHYRGFVICIKPKLKMDFFFIHPSNYFGEICNGDEVNVDVDLIAAQQGVLPFTEGTDYQFKMVTVRHSTSSTGPWTNGYGPITGSQNYANGQVLTPSEVKETLFQTTAGYIYIQYNLVLEDLMCNQTHYRSFVICIRPKLITSITVTDETCLGAGDGTITIIGNSPIGQLRYSIDGGSSFQPVGLFANLTPGIYNIVVKVFGIPEICQETATRTINPGPPYQTWWLDQDNDGYHAGVSQQSCVPIPNYSTTALPGDCNDFNNTVYPGAPELCDGLDNDCDNIVPANEADADKDGYRICDGDCDDNNASVYPGATEVCDGIDNNCNMVVDEGLMDETYVGNVLFTTQAQLDAWPACFSTIQGNVTILGFGINNLGPLANIETITGSLTIQSTSLTSLNGLGDLDAVGGTFTIFFNLLLTTLDGLDYDFSTVGGNLSVYYNFQLSNCCAIYKVINGGVTGPVVIFFNQVGCNSVAEINSNCAPPPPLIGNQQRLLKAEGSEIQTAARFDLFPNPASGEVNVLFNLTSPTATLKVIDLLGRVVFEEELEDGTDRLTIDLNKSPFKDGLYVVTLSENGEMRTKQLIVQR